MQTYATEALKTAVESAEKPSPEATRIRQNWQGKPTEELLSACQEVFYGGIVPILNESNDQHEEVEKTKALFEICWERFEELAASKSGSRRVPSSS